MIIKVTFIRSFDPFSLDIRQPHWTTTLGIYPSHGQPSSTAAPSESNHPSRSATEFIDPIAWPSFPGANSSDQSSHYGYLTAAPSVPLPAPADHQTPIPPGREEAYPLQMEIEEKHRQFHAHFFPEVRTHQADLW